MLCCAQCGVLSQYMRDCVRFDRNQVGGRDFASCRSAQAGAILQPEGNRNAVISIDTPSLSSGAQVMWLRPNRALSLRGLRWAAGLLAGYIMLVALVSSLAGNAYAPFFALVDVTVVVLAFAAVWRAGERAERITLTDDALEIARFPAARDSVRLQPYWVRVRLQPGGAHPRLTLVSHGHALEIGAFLGDEERQAVCKQLEASLARLRLPDHQQDQRTNS